MRSVILAVSGLVLIHDHVEHPVQSVLDAPMAAHDGIEALGREGVAEQIAARLDRRFAVDFAASGDLADRLKAGPVVALLQPGDVGTQRSRAGLDAAVAFVGVGRARERGLRIVEEAAHIVV